MKKHFKVRRYDPSKDAEPYWKEYDLEVGPDMTLLSALNRIKWEQDGTLVFRLSCAHGVCGSCAMKIDGVCGLACQTVLERVKGDEVVVEPLPGFRVQKDLYVDLGPFFENVRRVRPYLIAKDEPPEKERPQSEADRAKIDGVIRCILCASCTAACPVMYDENPKYIGPAAIVQAFRRIFDSRDGEKTERLRQMDDADMVHACVNYFECTRVCPKEILVTKSINTIKQEIKKAGL
jgi:succinate dehydrogenase / fumarate reductase iron-sulfur subunit